MKNKTFRFCLIILFSTFLGCRPNIVPVSVTPSSVALATNTPEFTSTVQPTPELTATSTPGANISFLYLAQGSIQKYNLQNWSEEKLSFQSDGDILQAALSPNKQWLVYQDKSGLKITERPFAAQPLIVSTVNSERTRFLFSSSSELLAYSDGEGLKIFDVLKNTSFTLLVHSPDQPDVSKIRFYSPQQWSPDSQWLWVAVSHWEHISHVLIHISTRTSHEFTACYSDTDWLPTSQAFVATVRYSDYYGCGDNDGIYLIGLTANYDISEKRIYQETVPREAWAREPHDIQLSPDGGNISFVQLSNPGTDLQVSRLILINTSDKESKELDSSQDDISTPIWSANDEKIFYSIQSEKESSIISLNINSGEKIVLWSVPQKAVLISLLADSDWLIIGTRSNSSNAWDSLYLVDSISGSATKISDLGYDIYIQPFLGSELFQ
ncbi:MAG: hypothetical protein H7Y59_09570 [Anaerolineales bacterium]|nr:hypothetical protein [Anaerolineales bacterium]